MINKELSRNFSLVLGIQRRWAVKLKSQRLAVESILTQIVTMSFLTLAERKREG